MASDGQAWPQVPQSVLLAWTGVHLPPQQEPGTLKLTQGVSSRAAAQPPVPPLLPVPVPVVPVPPELVPPAGGEEQPPIPSAATTPRPASTVRRRGKVPLPAEVVCMGDDYCATAEPTRQQFPMVTPAPMSLP